MHNSQTPRVTEEERLCGEPIAITATIRATGKRWFRGVSGRIYDETGKPVSREEAPDAYRTLEPNCRPATEAEKLMAIAKFNAMLEARQYA